jgi:hypothetical protein
MATTTEIRVRIDGDDRGTIKADIEALDRQSAQDRGPPTTAQK